MRSWPRREEHSVRWDVLMLALRVILEGDGCWPDLVDKQAAGKLTWPHASDPAQIEIAALRSGLHSGRPSVAIRIDLPDGRVVVAETSLRLFLQAAAALRGRYGEP